jgi:hypothetical protein
MVLPGWTQCRDHQTVSGVQHAGSDVGPPRPARRGTGRAPGHRLAESNGLPDRESGSDTTSTAHGEAAASYPRRPSEEAANYLKNRAEQAVDSTEDLRQESTHDFSLRILGNPTSHLRQPYAATLISLPLSARYRFVFSKLTEVTAGPSQNPSRATQVRTSATPRLLNFSYLPYYLQS